MELGSCLLSLVLLGATSCASPTQSAPRPLGWVVQLLPVTGAPAMGQATIHENGRQWMVMIAIQGLEPNRPHAANVRNGSCSGPVLYPLNALAVNATGYGYSDTDLDATPDGTWWIQVGDPESPPDQWVACGQILAD